MKTAVLYTIILFIIIVGFFIWLIVTQIEEFKLQDDPKLRELKDKIKPLFSKNKIHNGVLSSLNNRDIMKEVTLYKGEKSYTINKHKVFLCLKDEKNYYYDDMMLLHVLLHEIGHVLCNSIGHTEEFNNIFQALLDEASIMGIYDKDFEIIQNYCQY